MDFDSFISWEKTTRDTLDIKRVYIDMAGDLVSGIILSQIVYWYLPTKRGESKITITKDGKEWIAKTRYEWWEECRVTPKQVDLAIRKLEKIGILEAKVFRFNNAPTKHIRIVKDGFMVLWNSIVQSPIDNPFLPKGKKPIYTKGEKRISPKGKNEFTETVKTLTETTSEITSESVRTSKNSPSPSKEKEVAKHDVQESPTPNAAPPPPHIVPKKRSYTPAERDQIVPGFQQAYEKVIGAPVNLSTGDEALAVQAARNGYTPADMERATRGKMKEKNGAIPVFRFVIQDMHQYPAQPTPAQKKVFVAEPQVQLSPEKLAQRLKDMAELRAKITGALQ